MVDAVAPVSSFGEALADVLSGLLAAAQAFALSFAVVALPALVAFLVATASGSVSDDAGGWRTPVEIAAGIWLLAHGVPVTASGATLTLVPLGLTALVLFVCHVTARHAARVGWRTWAAATSSYAMGTTAVALAVPTVRGWSVLAALVAGALVGGLGFGVGTASRADGPSLAGIGDRIDVLVRGWFPPTLRLGLRAGGLAVTAVCGLAALLAGAWAVGGRATSSDIIRALDPGWAGGIVLAVAQLVLLPDLVLWAVAWLSGAGFAVGEGTSFTPTGVDAGPLPAVPLLAALPGEIWTGPAGWAVPLAVAGCGAAAGWFAWRGLDPRAVRWRDVGIVLGGLAASSALITGLLQTAASGAAGTARLAEVGAIPWLVALLVAGESTLGAAAVLVPARLRVRGT